ncbi:TetR/AcrR family transcriptional regulator [Thermodesulfobacteriota bacterium]
MTGKTKKMEPRTLEVKRNETTRSILEAAKLVFAEVGFSGARIDEIAKRAKVNKAMIYYRIGDKEALYGKVLHEVFADTAKRIATNIKSAQEPEAKLETYIHNLFQTIQKNPYLPQIMVREIASGGRYFPEVVLEDFATILGILMNILREGAEKGVFIKTNPLMVHVMFIGPVMSLKVIEAIKGEGTILAETLSRVIKTFPENIEEEIQKLVLRAVKK